jgi:hypothetical protein
MAIFEVEDGYVISAQQVWSPGIFDSTRAAKYMFRFSPCDQHQMWKDWSALKNVIPIPPIGFENMRKWKKEKAAKEPIK